MFLKHFLINFFVYDLELFDSQFVGLWPAMSSTGLMR